MNQTTMMKRMTSDEYREKIVALGLTQTAAAQFLAICERTSRRYALGETSIPGQWQSCCARWCARSSIPMTFSKSRNETSATMA